MLPINAPEPRREASWDSLAPGFAVRLHELTTKVIDCRIIETTRTEARQQWLFGAGRVRGGPMVTRAATAGLTWHGYGLAADLIHHELGYNAPDAWWRLLGRAAMLCGLRWGGLWTHPDRPHVQWGNLMPDTPGSRDCFDHATDDVAKVWARYGADRLQSPRPEVGPGQSGSPGTPATS